MTSPGLDLALGRQSVEGCLEGADLPRRWHPDGFQRGRERALDHPDTTSRDAVGDGHSVEEEVRAHPLLDARGRAPFDRGEHAQETGRLDGHSLAHTSTRYRPERLRSASHASARSGPCAALRSYSPRSAVLTPSAMAVAPHT